MNAPEIDVEALLGIYTYSQAHQKDSDVKDNELILDDDVPATVPVQAFKINSSLLQAVLPQSNTRGHLGDLESEDNVVTSKKAVSGKKTNKRTIRMLNDRVKRNKERGRMLLELSNKVAQDAAERPFACTYAGCGKAFYIPSSLAKHSRVHAGERPFACADEKLFVCTHEGCGKAFSSSAYRLRHASAHSIQKQFVCIYEGCTKAYFQPSALSRHVRVSHKNL